MLVAVPVGAHNPLDPRHGVFAHRAWAGRARALVPPRLGDARARARRAHEKRDAGGCSASVAPGVYLAFRVFSVLHCWNQARFGAGCGVFPADGARVGLDSVFWGVSFRQRRVVFSAGSCCAQRRSAASRCCRAPRAVLCAELVLRAVV